MEDKKEGNKWDICCNREQKTAGINEVEEEESTPECLFTR